MVVRPSSFLLVALAACARSEPPLAADSLLSRSVVLAAIDELAAEPPGYVEARIGGVHATAHGDVVFVEAKLDDRDVVLPVFVGGTEALTIKLRLDGKEYARPLTHDLFGATLEKLGARPLKVQIDSLVGSTYVGSVFVRQSTRAFELDARPSDAIAIALGSGVPIYVSRALLEAQGVPKRDLDLANPDRNVRRPKDPIAL